MSRDFLLLLLPVLLVSCAEEEQPSIPAVRTITGRVIADHNLVPISRAFVRSGSVTANTDSSGFFSLVVPLRSEPGHLDVLRVSADRFGESRPLAAWDEPMEIRLKTAFSVSGVVVDHDGRFVPGVRVRTRGFIESQSPYLSGVLEREAVTGKDGRFKIEGISREVSSQTVTLDAGGYGTVDLPLRVIEDVNLTGVELGRLELGPAHTVRLTVLGPGGAALSGIGVEMRQVSPTGLSVETSAEGVAVFDMLAPGRYHFIANPRGLPRMAALVEVPVDAEVVEARVGPPAGHSLTVLVRDPDGAPLTGAWLSLPGFASGPVTGEDGKVMIHGLPERMIRLSVGVPSDRRSELFQGCLGPLVPAGQEVEVTLQRRATISGRAKRTDGTPAAGATVRAAGKDGWTIAGAAVGPDGKFSFHAPAGVSLRLMAVTRRKAEGRMKGPIPTPNALGVIPEVVAPAKDVEISLRTLARDLSLTVRVLDPEGAPVEGAEVAINGSNFRPFTDAGGLRRFLDLTEWKVEVMARFGRIGIDTVPPAPVELVPANQEVELRFRRAEICRGTVRLPDGTPVRWAEIRLVTEDGATCHARTDERGYFSVAALPGRPHSLSVRYESPEYYSYRAYRENLVPGPQDLEITLTLSAD